MSPDAPPSYSKRVADALRDRYDVDRVIGRGGMSIVFLARDRHLGREVAIKVLDPEACSAVGAERFLREVRITAPLQHPNVLPLIDSGTVGDIVYSVSPYVEGDTLRERLLREGQLPVEEALLTAREVAEALEYAHKRGVVHRDIKPENILLSNGQAVVADFGTDVACPIVGAAPPETTKKLMCLTKDRIGLKQSDTRVKVAFANTNEVGGGILVCAMFPMSSITGTFAPVLDGRVVTSKVEMRIEKVDETLVASAETALNGDWSWCA